MFVISNQVHIIIIIYDDILNNNQILYFLDKVIILHSSLEHIIEL